MFKVIRSPRWVALGALALAFSSLSAANTYIVTNTADSGAGSLRQAILDANANSGQDTIVFNIAGTGPFTIVSPTALTITDSVIIDGTSQPGYSGAPLIEIQGTAGPTGNSIPGISLNASSCTIQGLSITNYFYGIFAAAARSDISIYSNYLGLRPDGVTTMGDSYGLYLTNCINSRVGMPNAGNVASGDLAAALAVEGGSNNRISSNICGLDSSGTVAKPNAQYGIIVLGDDSVVGGSGPGEGNVSSCAINGAGIACVSGSRNVISGNYIGLDKSGTSLVIASGTTPFFGVSCLNGITVAGSDDTVGDVGDTGKNIIGSANTMMSVSGTNIHVLQNWVGFNKLGTAFTGSISGTNPTGIAVTGGTGIVIGGDPNWRNVIGAPIALTINANAVVVKSNWIGVRPDGVSAAKSVIGISLAAKNDTVIGGTTASDRNVIAFCTQTGIQATGGCLRTIIKGNYIGVNAVGGIGSDASSILLNGSNSVIGGPEAGAGNYMSGGGSLVNGFTIVGSDNLVQGNSIGISPLGQLISGGRTIVVSGATSLRNKITRNSIAGANFINLDLGGDGITPNDVGDADTGPNGLQNYPVITHATIVPGGIHITGTLNSIPGKTYTVEVFQTSFTLSAFVDAAQNLLTSIPVSTDGSGNGSFDVTLPGTFVVSDRITATATDPDGNTSEISDKFFIVANHVPVANAGPDQTVAVPHDHDPATNTANFTLDGSASNDPDGDSLTYSWTEGVTVLGTTATLPLTKTPGTYTFTLSVTDAGGTKATDTVVVTVNPEPNATPVANAGTDQTVQVAHDGDPATNTASVTLTATASDADSDSLTYAWKDETNTTVGTALILNTSLASGDHTYTFTAADTYGATATSTVHVHVSPEANAAPTCSAGSPVTVAVPHDGSTVTNTAAVTLTGTASDPDSDPLTYAWTVNSTAAGNSATISANLAAGDYDYVLTVTDPYGKAASSTVHVHVDPEPNGAPAVIVGPDQTAQVPHDGNPATNIASATISGGATDPDGDSLTYEWSQGATVLGTGTSLAVSVAPGDYTYTFTAKDPYAAVGSGTVHVHVDPEANATPVTIVGPDQIVQVAHDGNPATNTAAVTVGGSATDSDNDLLSYKWTDESNAVLGNAQSLTTDLTVGSHTLTLTATDAYGASSSASVHVTVAPEANAAPTVTVGPDQTITIPHDGNPATNFGSAILNATASDPDGDALTYQWVQDSITPVSNTLTTGAVVTPGDYTFTFTATDPYGASASATLHVHVDPEFNRPPTISAGNGGTSRVDHTGNPADNTVTFPVISAETDLDGDPFTVVWTDENNNVIATTPNITVTLAVGVHTLTITATDNYGASSSKSEVFTILPQNNFPPHTIVGPDQTVHVAHDGNPADMTATVTVTGSAADFDNDPVTYQWTDESNNVLGTSTNLAVSLTVGTHALTLRATDPYGATSSASVHVTVLVQTNAPPAAIVGPDQTIQVPHSGTPAANTASVTVSGSATDPDNDTLTYKWTDESNNVLGTGQSLTTTLAVGVHALTLTATDPYGASSSATAHVVVTAQANSTPVAVAGANQTLTLMPGNTTTSATLNGSGSADPDHDTLTYSWSDGSNVVGTSASVSVTEPAGTFTFTLTVTDPYGASSSASTTVVVNTGNQPPVAVTASVVNATVPHDGNPATNTAPVSLDGSGSNDPDAGQTLTYQWRDQGNAVVGSAAHLTVTLTPGTYTYTLTVTDPFGAASSATTTVTVFPEPNAAPLVNGGADQAGAAGSDGTASVTLSASATDADGDPITFKWFEGATQLGSSAILSTTLSAGTHTLTVTATDPYGASTSDTVVVSVQYTGYFFEQPINNDGSSIFKLGSTVPVKFDLTGASASANVTAHIFIAKVTNNIIGTEMEPISTGNADTGNIFRASGGGEYIFNLSTKNLTSGTYQIRADLGDGNMTHVVLISIK